MSQFEKYLLELAYNNYLKTYDLEFKFVPKNSNDLVHTINSLNSLEESGYVEVLSDNLNKDTLNLLTEDMIFIFKLNDKSLSLIRNNWQP